MAVQTAQGTVSLNTSSGNQSVTGMPFEPKVVFFQIVARNSTGSSSDFQYSFGFAKNAAGGYSASMSNANGEDPTDLTCALSNTQIFRVHDLIGTGLDFEGAFVSMNSDGFTWDNVNPPSSDWDLYFLAVGGDDITDVEIGEFDIDASSLGNVSVTGVGFQPDFVLALTRNANTNYNSTVNDIRNNIGFAIDPNNQGMIINKGTDGENQTDETTYQSTTSFMGGIASGDIQWEAEFASMDADGFTYEVIKTVGTARKGLYLAIKGGQWHVDNFLAHTAQETFDVTDAGFEPKGLSVFSNMKVVSGSVVADLMLSSGFSDFSGLGLMLAITAEDGQSSADTSSSSFTNSIQRTMDHTQSTIGRINVDSALSNGFRLDQSNPDDDAVSCLYFCVGDNAVIGGGGGKLVNDNPLLGNKLVGGTLIG